MTDYTVTADTYTEGQTLPSSGVVGNTLIQRSTGTGATIVALAAAAKEGARGLRISVPTGIAAVVQFGPNPEAGEVSDNCALRFAWKCPAAPPSSNVIIGAVKGGTGSTSMGLMIYTTAGKLALGNRTGSVVAGGTFPTSPTPGSWYVCTLGAQRGTTGTAPISTNGVINGAFYPWNNATPVDTPLNLTGQDTGQVASRYANVGIMVAVTNTVTPYIQDVDSLLFRTGSSAIIPPTVTAATGVFYSANGSTLTPATLYYSANGTTLTPVSIG